jgi:hypothetical protein
MSGTAERRLFVAWRDPESRQYHPVGRLDVGEDSSFVFRYLKGALHAPGFSGLRAFPDLQAVYASDRLFPFFANRVMNSARRDRAAYAESLGLAHDADPIVLLEHGGGGRTTDTLEIFSEPTVDPESGLVAARFWARGLRHIPGAIEAVSALHVGDKLIMHQDRENDVTTLAIRLEDGAQRVVGYIPTYLLALVHDSWDHFGLESAAVLVERVNPPEVSPTTRLLCYLTARLPAGSRPLSSAEFEPLAA